MDKKDIQIREALKTSSQIGSAGFATVQLVHNALPEIDFSEIDTATEFLGKKMAAPLLMAPMTGGTEKALVINKNLAKAAQRCGIAMAVGSQKKALKTLKSSDKAVAESFMVRQYASDVPLLANFGAVDLNYGFGLDEARRAVEMIGADGLILHLNPIQEVIQNGETDFSNLLTKIEKLVKKLVVPVLVGEVGFGISGDVALRLKNIGIKYILTGGWGGTNWAKIPGSYGHKHLAEVFSQWGLSTVESIKQCRRIKGLQIIAVGGVRSGLDMAKALSLGACLSGMAQPFLQPALQSEQAVVEKIEQIVLELRLAMFGLGVKTMAELRANDC